MKLNKYLFITALAGMTLAGCADLDTAPKGNTITADQKAEVVAENPEMVSASVTGITSMFSIYENTSGNHNDFGYPSVMLFTDSRGIDLVGMDVGYNWFSYGLDLNDGALTHTNCNSVIFRTLYNQIYTANSVAGIIDANTDDPTLQFYLAQALAIRAFDYFNLAQLYQFTYEGNEDAPCVPLITEANADDAAANGAPRATVGDVYTQIMTDLNKAVDLLRASSFRRADKRYVSLEVALGLRARVELVMQNWGAAATDAQEVINSGAATPISIEEASKPGFKDMNEKDWLWGIYIAETDRVVTSGIVNWISHMGSLNYGYASVGAWRRINSTLYNLISVSDARKGWWLGPDATSPNLTAEQQDYLTNDAEAPAYTQVKFAPYKDEVYTSTNANDVPLMRVEEMYYILAEAQAMGGNPAQGAATLQSFTQTYRDPAYTCSGASASSVQDAVWVQRRIELWGEGISFFDLMRLRKGVDRPSTGWATMDSNMPQYNFRILDTKADERAAIEQVKAGKGSSTGEPINALIFQIPEREVQSNPGISEGDNNLGAPILEPVN